MLKHFLNSVDCDSTLDLDLSSIAQLTEQIGHCQNIEQLRELIVKKLESNGYVGFMSIECFGVNRACSFGRDPRFSKPPEFSSLDAGNLSMLTERGILFSRPTFTIEFINNKFKISEDMNFINSISMFASAVDYWINSYTQPVDSECEVLTLKRRICGKLLGIIQDLESLDQNLVNCHDSNKKEIDNEIFNVTNQYKDQHAQAVPILIDQLDSISISQTSFMNKHLSRSKNISEYIRKLASSILSD